MSSWPSHRETSLQNKLPQGFEIVGANCIGANYNNRPAKQILVSDDLVFTVAQTRKTCEVSERCDNSVLENTNHTSIDNLE